MCRIQYFQNLQSYQFRLTNAIILFYFLFLFQAQAALMYDAVFVLVEAFSKLLKKKPDQFRSYTQRRSPPFNQNGTSHGGPNNGGGGSSGGNNGRALDCNTSKGWEHGDKISRYLRKVSPIPIIRQTYTLFFCCSFFSTSFFSLFFFCCFLRKHT